MRPHDAIDPRRRRLVAAAAVLAALFAVPAWAVPVRVTATSIETAFNQQYAIYLRPQGVNLRGVQLHWVDDVQVTDKGRLERAEVGAVLKAADAIGNPLEIQCAASFVAQGGRIVFDPRAPLNPSCVVNTTPSRMTEADFSTQEWYPHAGPVDRYSFHALYDAFDLFLTRRGYYTPSWNRDSWILRAMVDSGLRVQRLWIFASALIDRESLNIEKRADCHGEVYLQPTGKRGGDVNQNDRWAVSPAYTCRIQLYRYGPICYGPQPGDCDDEWSPCEGQACQP